MKLNENTNNNSRYTDISHEDIHNILEIGKKLYGISSKSRIDYFREELSKIGFSTCATTNDGCGNIMCLIGQPDKAVLIIGLFFGKLTFYMCNKQDLYKISNANNTEEFNAAITDLLVFYFNKTKNEVTKIIATQN
ncbi:hypothetical protein KA977_04020 [Candidatus Dependentiae bacterium]|nr:hypothetical protein [Candidatus Dependentiae bacterium]